VVDSAARTLLDPPAAANKETIMLRIPSPRTFGVTAVMLAASLLFTGCVTRSAYNEVVAERDDLTVQNRVLRSRAAAMTDVAAGLSAEQTLREQELAQLRREQEELADEIAAWAVLGAIKMQLLADGLHILLPHDVLFASGSAVLKPEGEKLVGELVQELGQQPYQIAVLGFTDNVAIGPQLAERFPSNWELAGARAASVVRLMQAEGIPSSQLVVVSQGENQPIASNDTPEGRAENRRIDVRIRPVVR
jgi:chemotaxis protein MotB